MPKIYEIQYRDPEVADVFDRFDPHDRHWLTLRKDTDPVRLLHDIVNDLNDDFGEFDEAGKPMFSPETYYWRLITTDA
ncbi:MAG: hypothetical protein ACK4S4_15610 [Pyrinomonadaceae bacterium]